MALHHLGLFLVIAAIPWSNDAHVEGAKILLSPFSQGINSRIRNLQFLGQLLVEQGHEVHMIIPALEPGVIEKAAPNLRYWSYQLSSAPDISNTRFLKAITEGSLNWHLPELLDNLLQHCESFLQGGLLPKLKRERFHLLIEDTMDICNRIIINYMDIPTILYANFAHGYDLHLFDLVPMNPSYHPSPYQPSTDRMSFIERLISSIDFMANFIVTSYWVYPGLADFQEKYKLNVTVPIADANLRISLILCNANFAFDHSRALQPSVINIGGIYFKPAKPLQPQTILDFVNGAGEDGVIVVSFGSLVSHIPVSKAEVMATVFARLRQRVIWRYDGPALQHLGSNIMTVPWLPQNDLLGHNKTKLFVSHCGVSSTHEAINHAVPVIAVPLFVDQPFQAAKLVSHGMAVKVDYLSISEGSLEAAIKTMLINYTLYKNKAVKLSNLVKDQPMPIKDKVLYWVEYVLRHGRAEHLQPKALRQLHWYQYWLLDVILFVVLVLVASLFLFLCFLRLVVLCCIQLYVWWKEKSRLKRE